LTFPVHETVSLVRSQANDSLGLATAPSGNIVALSRYLAPRTVGVRYELAADEPLALAPLIIRDQRPILPLTSFNVKLVGVDRLLAAIRSGAVRYGVVANAACDGRAGSFAPCTDASLWIRRHGIDVTPQVGLSGRLRVYLLDPARAG
jgi:hypothetical protein